MKFFRFLSLVFLSFLVACGGGGEKTVEESADPADIMGTWKRVKYKPETNPDTTWLDPEPGDLYYKHITPTHFNWIWYTAANDQMSGAGGGLYTFDGKEYIEDIEFFVPTGSSARGQSVPFDAKFEGRDWYHTGSIRNFELDAELGEYVVSDSSAVTEIWQKVEDDGSNTSGDFNLVGSWILVKNMEYPDTTWIEYPSFVGKIKHITGTHWGRAQYEIDEDVVTDLGGGAYTLEGNKYTEYVEYGFPKGIGQTNAKFEFTVKVEEDLLYQEGWIYTLDDQGQAADSSYINEVWRKYQ